MAIALQLYKFDCLCALMIALLLFLSRRDEDEDDAVFDAELSSLWLNSWNALELLPDVGSNGRLPPINLYNYCN